MRPKLLFSHLELTPLNPKIPKHTVPFIAMLG